MPTSIKKIFEYRINYDKLCAILIGIGVALFPIHNRWITSLVTNDRNEVGFFLPAFGAAIWIIGTIAYAIINRKYIKLGEKQVYIPLIIIVIAIAISGITADSIEGKLSPLFLGVALFALYAVSRILGKTIFIPLTICSIIVALGVITSAIINRGVITGGLIFEGNYDIVIGYLLMGLIVSMFTWQWLMAILIVVALLLTGSPEGLFALAICGVAVIYKRDVSHKLLYLLVVVMLIGIIWLGFGWGQKLYHYAENIAIKYDATQPYIETNEPTGRSPIGYRLWVIQTEIQNIKPLGDGYNITQFFPKIIHNVPLIIVQQLGYIGILAVLAWLWVTFYCLIKTRWRYAWVALLSLCIFDHYIWTQLAPVWWMLAGVSLTSDISDDLIFRKKQQVMVYQNNHFQSVAVDDVQKRRKRINEILIKGD